jgi:phosphopantothenoylcysteine synthetase/decarboxylase
VRCIVTAGPTYEPLDEVRRLTNFSTGRLGVELAGNLTALGHEVTLLLGYYATWRGPQNAQVVDTFTTTADLRDRLRALASPVPTAIFHAAAVSDFGFGRVWEKTADGTLKEVHAAKVSTRQAGLLVELGPTPKILAELRQWHPHALLVGWKYELDGGREDVLAKASQQLAACATDACVANGQAYGEGFGLVTPDKSCRHCATREALYEALAGLLSS